VVDAVVVRDVQLRQQVTVEVVGRRGEGPSPLRAVREHRVGSLLVAHRVRCGLLEAEEQLLATVLRVGQTVVHLDAAVDRRVEHRAVREVVGDEDVHMAVAVEVVHRNGVGVPLDVGVLAVDHLRVRHQLGRRERLGAQFGRVLLAEEDHRRAAPVVGEHVHPAVLVEVTGGAAHRRDRVVGRQRP
jgi:hypothetical protein